MAWGRPHQRLASRCGRRTTTGPARHRGTLVLLPMDHLSAEGGRPKPAPASIRSRLAGGSRSPGGLVDGLAEGGQAPLQLLLLHVAEGQPEVLLADLLHVWADEPLAGPEGYA